ncbi:MAG TPA: hypothetical protein VK054_00940 [Beutenbergiaceae bacterium]|nr:hypothetical protein [Beutenbergiaceae bacterium]
MVKKAKRPVKAFKHPKTGHETATSLPVEQNRLRAQGYVEQKSAARSAPAAKPADPKK